jgi:hypothetical protein
MKTWKLVFQLLKRGWKKNLPVVIRVPGEHGYTDWVEFTENTGKVLRKFNGTSPQIVIEVTKKKGL